MNHDKEIKFLKLHFGTLFLVTYRLPKLKDVVNNIDNGVVDFTKFFPYASVLILPVDTNTNTKPCDCYEKEQSGDCHCVD